MIITVMIVRVIVDLFGIDVGVGVGDGDGDGDGDVIILTNLIMS